jgi:hypothetical protein
VPELEDWLAGLRVIKPLVVPIREVAIVAFRAAYSALVRCRRAQEIRPEPIEDSDRGEACCTTTKVPYCRTWNLPSPSTPSCRDRLVSKVRPAKTGSTLSHRRRRVLSVGCTVQPFFSSHRRLWSTIPQLGSRPGIEPQARPRVRGCPRLDTRPVGLIPIGIRNLGLSMGLHRRTTFGYSSFTDKRGLPAILRSNEAESRISSSRFQILLVFRWHIVAEDSWV